jgi:hypothetical protein
MKNLLLLVCFFLAGSMSLNAQAKKACKKSGKACCAKKAAAATTTADTKVASASMTAELTPAEALAQSDENIQVRVNDESGEKSFYKKSQCEVSGKVSWDEVKYCDESKAFTKVASASMERDAEVSKADKSATTTAKKACCAKGDKKACCSKGDKKACKKKAESN